MWNVGVTKIRCQKDILGAVFGTCFVILTRCEMKAFIFRCTGFRAEYREIHIHIHRHRHQPYSLF